MTNEKPVAKKQPVETPKAKNKGIKIAVILVRGLIGIDKRILDALISLRLKRKNCCVIIESTPDMLGMLEKAKDYITWGEIDDETLKELLTKRAEKNPRDPKKTKSFFRLNSPRKGFGRLGIKKPFSQKGALGNRRDKINDLIRRMI